MARGKSGPAGESQTGLETRPAVSAAGAGTAGALPGALVWRFALVVAPPHLRNVTLPPGQPAFGQIGGNNNELAALRTQPACFDRDQLYDLAGDPGGQRTLAADPRQAGKLAELKGELRRHLARLPGGCGEFKPVP